MPILKTDSDQVEVNAGQPLLDAGEQIGVPFGCCQGRCGACAVTIEEGRENLSNLTEEEEDQDCDDELRLCCQMHLKQGTVKIRIGH